MPLSPFPLPDLFFPPFCPTILPYIYKGVQWEFFFFLLLLFFEDPLNLIKVCVLQSWRRHPSFQRAHTHTHIRARRRLVQRRCDTFTCISFWLFFSFSSFFFFALTGFFAISPLFFLSVVCFKGEKKKKVKNKSSSQFLLVNLSRFCRQCLSLFAFFFFWSGDLLDGNTYPA